MELLLDVLRLLVSILIAFLAGNLIAKGKLPSILGWLIAGMLLGPYALGLLGNGILDARWFEMLKSVFECTFGLMIGTELIWKKMRKAGSQIVITTVTESLGTFLVVSLVFGVIFLVVDIPLYLAFVFGGIALATAPAPSLSVVRDMKADGPVTRTLIPMAALDDLVGALVFFLVIAFVSAHISTQGIPVPVVLFLVFLPVLLGMITGFITGELLRMTHTQNSTLSVVILMLLVSVGIGAALNSLLPAPVINFMLIGMSFSTVFANMVSEEKLKGIMKVMDPIIGVAMIVVILSLGAPLDYHLIFGAGIYTAVYIVARAIGKYLGAYFGASVTHAPKPVRKYLGFTLLPHSGVSLVFTGIAVFMAKKGFEWAGELGRAKKTVSPVERGAGA